MLVKEKFLDPDIISKLARNYIGNSGFEENIDGYLRYTNAAAGVPTTGTGSPGAGTSLGWVNSPGLVLCGRGSLIYTKDAANRQGQGFSYDFEIDPGYAGEQMQVSFRYKSSVDYVSNDIRVFVYDLTNNTVSPVMNDQSGNILASLSPVGFLGTFQSASNSVNYRLIFHIASTNATGYFFYLDDVEFGPSQLLPVFNGEDLGTETWTDSQANATTSVEITRLGSWFRGKFTVSFTGAQSGGMDITVPTKYLPASSSYSFAGGRAYTVGSLKLVDSGTTYIEGIASLTAATNLAINVLNTSSTYATVQSTSATIPFTWANGDSVVFDAMWKVEGWQASTVFSTTSLNRMGAKAVYSGNTGGSITANVTNIIWNTKTQDTLSNWNGSQFIAHKDMFVAFSGMVFLGTASNNDVVAYVDGSASKTVSDPQTSTQGKAINGAVSLLKGQALSFRFGSNNTLSNVPLFHHISIWEVFDPIIYGAYTPFITQTAVSSIKTPPATSGIYLAMTGNSITLNPTVATVWDLDGLFNYGNGGTSPAINGYGGGFYAANGGDNSTSLSALSTICQVLTVFGAGVQTFEGNGASAASADVPALKVRIFINQPVTIYMVPYIQATTPANARVRTYFNATAIK